MTQAANQTPNGTQKSTDALPVQPAEVDCYEADKPEEIESGRIGVYIYVDTAGDILYIGEAFAQNRDLRKRIGQNYIVDNAGTFRANWAPRNGGGKESKKKVEHMTGKEKQIRDDIIEDNIRRFKCAAKNWMIITLSVSKNFEVGEAKKQRRLIHVLEKALIAFLDPKYNKD